MVSTDPNTWFLKFSSKVYPIANGDGRPWGDGTAMAAREGTSDPWDNNCRVMAMIGGYEAMRAMREDLEKAIGFANSQPASVTQRGHVYITDWRFNPLRDLSEVNDWKTSSSHPQTGLDGWDSKTSVASIDQTALGLVLRLMQAGIQVRMLLWTPTTLAETFGFHPQVEDHFYAARVVQAESARLKAPDRGIVALDLRVTDRYFRLDVPLVAAHHQKMMVIRVGNVNVAYCGGVDLAFTRRDAWSAPTQYKVDQPQFLDGDWQSGKSIPIVITDSSDPTHRWPKAPNVHYDSLAQISDPPKSDTDLPVEVYGDRKQIWHDQHLRLEGPIVKTLEEQFRERWIDSTIEASAVLPSPLGAVSNFATGQVIFSTDTAFSGSDLLGYKVNPLPPADDSPLSPPLDPPPVPVTAFTAPVQMWRTIPLRGRFSPPFTRGEFTIMDGIAHACQSATEMIWIFDQYFFSRPIARLLNYQLSQHGSLYVLLVLPPFADDKQLTEHHARKMALNDLTQGPQGAQVAVYNLWHQPRQQGIYCHTKVQMYDRTLLVCGSANLNRRSFTCDSELDCAVLSPELVDYHQHRLWNVLFPNITWPSEIDFTQSGWGKSFFTVFNKVVAQNQSSVFLIPDPWQIDPQAQITLGTRTVNTQVGAFTQVTADIAMHPPTVPNQSKTAREQDYPEDYLTAVQQKADQDMPGLPPVITKNIRIKEGQQAHKNVFYDIGLEPTSLTPDVEKPVSEGGILRECRLDDIVTRIEKPDAKGKWPRRVR